MAAKLSNELKAHVKELRDRTGIFIDLRRATEQECLDYIAVNSKHGEIEKVEPEVESDIPDVIGAVAEAVEIANTKIAERNLALEMVEDIKQSDDYWKQWESSYDRAIANLQVAPTLQTEETSRRANPAIIGIAIAMVIAEIFQVAVMAINWSKKEAIKRQLIEKSFGSAAKLAHQFKQKTKVRGFATWA
jgi:hypothetical protein